MMMLRFAIAAGPEIGLGHLRRMQVLARAALAGDFTVALHVSSGAQHVAVADGLPPPIAVDDWHQLPAADGLIADGEIFNADHFRAWRKKFAVMTAIDDTASRPLDVDLLVNPGLNADTVNYRHLSQAQILAGPQYGLIDPGFFVLRQERPSTARALVAFGASDDGQIAAAVATALLAVEPLEIDLVTSPLRAVAAAVRDAVDLGGGRITVHHGADMAALMAQATVYCGAAGVTVTEALAAGRAIVTAAIVDNQQANISALQKAGLAAFRHVDSAAMAAAVSAVCAAEYQPPPTLQIGAEGAEKILAAILAKR